MVRLLRLGLAVGFATLLPFCSTASDNVSACNAGDYQACQCWRGDSGQRYCASDGSGWGACICGGDAGPDGAAGASGAAGSGASGGSSGGGGSSGSAGSGGAAAGAGGGAGQDGSAGSAGASGASGAGGSAADSGLADGGSCPAGSATNISGSCDVVLQDCGGGLTCGTVADDAGAYQTSCVDLGNGAAQLGDACTSHTDCAAGLRCALQRCTRPCCSQLESSLCGVNGTCDLQITYGGGAFLQVCTFAPSCTLWAHDCPSGPESDCHVASGGRFKCSFPNYNLDAGSTEGQSCSYINDCADSQYCLVTGSGGTGTCRWLCKAGTSGAPDAGTVGGAPGLGGCPGSQTCHAFGNSAWLGVCEP